MQLPRDYIDPEHSGLDRQMLETFYLACRAEGGTADEIHLRGLKAVLAEAALAQPRAVVPPPSGWAYCYPTMDGSVIRFNHGQKVNESKPLYAIPYWLGQPPAPSLPAAPGEGE
jgi:hypothetical protein